MNLNDKPLYLFGPTIHTQWNRKDSANRDVLIDHMVNLFGNTFNQKVVAKFARENLKYTRAQYRDKLQLDLNHEHPPMVPKKEWKALIEDAKENLLKRQGKQPWPRKARYNTYHLFSEICSFIIFFFVLSKNSDI